MVDSNTALSDKPTKNIDEVDFIEVLKSRIPEENERIEGISELLEISNSSIHEEILNRGCFTRDDLEKLLQNEENLQLAIAYLVKENNRLSIIAKSKDEKILTSVDLIVSQRDWVHSLLDDNESLRNEVNGYIKSKHDLEVESAYQISALKNEKEEMEDKLIALSGENQSLVAQISDFDEQLKKSAGVLKKSQLHKNALAEKIDTMEANQYKNKMYLGILGAAAFVFFSLAVVSFLNKGPSNGVSNSEVAGKVSEIDAGTDSVATVFGESPAGVTNSTPVDLPPEGFITSDVVVTDNDPVVVDNMKVLDDKKVDEILKQPLLNSVPSSTPKSKPSAPIANKDVVKKKPAQSYVVKEKDSLYQISKKFYGSGNYVNKIKKENKLGNTLVPGKKLIISALDEE